MTRKQRDLLGESLVRLAARRLHYNPADAPQLSGLSPGKKHQLQAASRSEIPELGAVIGVEGDDSLKGRKGRGQRNAKQRIRPAPLGD